MNDSWKSNFMAPETSTTANQIKSFSVPSSGTANCSRKWEVPMGCDVSNVGRWNTEKKRKVGTEEGKTLMVGMI